MLQGWLGVLAPAAVQTWKYVVGVRNGTNQYLYVDGVLANATITVNPAKRQRRFLTMLPLESCPGPSRWSGGGRQPVF